VAAASGATTSSEAAAAPPGSEEPPAPPDSTAPEPTAAVPATDAPIGSPPFPAATAPDAPVASDAPNTPDEPAEPTAQEAPGTPQEPAGVSTASGDTGLTGVVPAAGDGAAVPRPGGDRPNVSDLLAPGSTPAATAAAGAAGATLTRKDRRAAAESAKGGRKGRKGKKKGKRTWFDRVLLGGVCLVALTLVAVGVGYGYLQYRFNQVAKVTVKHLKVAPPGQPFNVLLIGSDSRADVSAANVSHLGDEENAGGQRSDVVKIVHVVPATGQVNVLSIPRDTMVSVAGDTSEIGKYNRINATYNTGPDQLVQTIEADFGIPIEHTVQINFSGFVGAVDAIGGINLNFPYPAKDVKTGLNITTPGCQHLNGGYSLAVARSRDYEYLEHGYWQYDGTGDYGRIQRQNAFLKALINQAETKYNPLTLNAFIGSVVQGVTIDSTFTVSDLLSLARQFHTFASQSLVTATLPTYSAGSDLFSSFGSVLYVQQPQANQVIAQFLGQPPEVALTPPPGPDGVVSTSTTTSTTYPHEGSIPNTSTSSSTTTTIDTNFDPTPC
jgi:LCP family protein required for cell wall assembly